MSKQLVGQATADQIEAWKKEFGKIFKYQVDNKVCYLRTVDRDTFSAAAAKVSTSPAKFNDIVINNIWLGGDETIKKEDSYYFGLIEFVEELMAKKKGSLEAC